MGRFDRVILLGSSGLLGRAFAAALTSVEVVTVSRELLQPALHERLTSIIYGSGAKLVINCAADTNTEVAEDRPATSFTANVFLPERVAIACKAVGAQLVHCSSTGCYGTYKDTPYIDYDPLRPTTVHHQSKAAGERAVRESGCEHLILRLGWLYGGPPGHRKNFVWTRLLEAAGKPEMRSDPFQYGCPTNVDDVVGQALILIDNKITGIFNCVAAGRASRLQYVQRILDAAGMKTILTPERFARRAPVSTNETAENFKLTLLGLNSMPEWTIALDRYIEAVMPQLSAVRES